MKACNNTNTPWKDICRVVRAVSSREKDNNPEQQKKAVFRIPGAEGNTYIPRDVLVEIVGYAASHCFGVKGICARNVSDGIFELLGVRRLSRGVKITRGINGVDIELHVACENGINLTTVGDSIRNEVRFVVEHDTGLRVGRVDVCIDYVDCSEENDD